jgi:acyl carrier protein
MEEKLLETINFIRENKGLSRLSTLNEADKLNDDLEFTSFDLAELTVRLEDEFDVDIFEDGIVSTIGEIRRKLSGQ